MTERLLNSHDQKPEVYPGATELRDSFYGDNYEAYQEFADIIAGLDEVPEGLTYEERTRQSYGRLRELLAEIDLPSELLKDMPRLFALYDAAAVLAPDVLAQLGIHISLTTASIIKLGNGSPQQQEYLRQLEMGAAIGAFLMNELGRGSDVPANVGEAEATDDGWMLNTPNAMAIKFMPNVATTLPRIAIVAVRARVGGEDEGIFPFIVPLRGEDGEPLKGIEISTLPEKSGLALDHAMIKFNNVHLPRDAWLSGDIAQIDEDGNFVSDASKPQRFAHTASQIVNCRLGLSSAVVTGARSALWRTYRYAEERRTARGKMMIEHDNVLHNLTVNTINILGATALGNAVRGILADPEAEAGHKAYMSMLAKPHISELAATVARSSRIMTGAQGVMNVNGYPWIESSIAGISTAEGVNDLMQLNAGLLAKLGDSEERAMIPGAPASRSRWGDLLFEREHMLAKSKWQDTASPEFGKNTHAIGIADAVADRATYDALRAAAAQRHGEARNILETVAEGYALQRIYDNGEWNSRQERQEIKRHLVETQRQVAEKLPTIMAAFALEGTVKAPMIDGYVDNWARYHAENLRS